MVCVFLFVYVCGMLGVGVCFLFLCYLALDYYLIGRHFSLSRRSAPVHCCDLEETQSLLAECMPNVNEK